MRRVLGFVMVTIGLAPLAAEASDGFRCPDTDKLVSLGQSTYEVRSRCREPDSATSRKETRSQQRTVRRQVNGEWRESTESYDVEVAVDEWTYDFGANRLIRFLRFENDHLVRVNEGKYGTDRS